MRPKTLLRASVFAAAALAASITLSGCTTIAGNVLEHAAIDSAQKARAVAKAEADAGRPKKGECWEGSFSYADGYANWGSRPPVNCDQAHDLYTFAVVPLEESHKGKLFTKAGYAQTSAWNDAYDTCSDAQDDDFAVLDETVQRVYIETYLPEEKQWDAGARWVRCDIAILKVGTSVKHPVFEQLPAIADLRQSINDAPAQFDFCVNDPGGLGSGGPKGGNAVYADCRDNPQWRLEGDHTIVDPANDAYPTPAELNAAYLVSCKNLYADATHITYVYYPTKSDWDDGTDTLECWVGRK